MSNSIPKPQPTVWLVVANDSSMRSLKTVIGKFDTLKEANAYLKEQGPGDGAWSITTQAPKRRKKDEAEEIV